MSFPTTSTMSASKGTRCRRRARRTEEARCLPPEPPPEPEPPTSMSEEMYSKMEEGLVGVVVWCWWREGVWGLGWWEVVVVVVVWVWGVGGRGQARVYVEMCRWVYGSLYVPRTG